MTNCNVNKYLRTIIYKICCKDLAITEIYIGNTINFRSRKHRHKTNCYNPKHKHYNYKIYKFIREHGGWDNWEIIELEKFPCNDPNEARARERYWFEQLNATLNVQRPFVSQSEYKEEALCYAKMYREKNKEYLQNYYKNYYLNNKKRISQNRKLKRESKKIELNNIDGFTN